MDKHRGCGSFALIGGLWLWFSNQRMDAPMLARLMHSSTLKIKQVYHWLLLNQCALCQSPSQLSICSDCVKTLPELKSSCPKCALPNPHGQICGSCLITPPSYAQAFIPYLYQPPVDHLLKQWKYHHQYQHQWLTKGLIELLRTIEVDAIVPLPCHWMRRLKRGRDHTAELSKQISQALAIPTLNALKRRVNTATQRGLDRKMRQRNLKNAFEAKQSVAGLNLVLVDDVMTTGTTVEVASKTLMKAGAKSVTVACIARTPHKTKIGRAHV